MIPAVERLHRRLSLVCFSRHHRCLAVGHPRTFPGIDQVSPYVWTDHIARLDCSELDLLQYIAALSTGIPGRPLVRSVYCAAASTDRSSAWVGCHHIRAGSVQVSVKLSGSGRARFESLTSRHGDDHIWSLRKRVNRRGSLRDARSRPRYGRKGSAGRSVADSPTSCSLSFGLKL